MKKLTLILVALAALAASSTLVAQNYGAEPLYGTFTLVNGFTPDPTVVAVQAGGSTDASTLGLVESRGGYCNGFINVAAPDVRLHYTAGAAYPLLRLWVESAADTTLVVNLPDTAWVCNDDSNGLNPEISLPNPPSGQFDIWVGVWSGAEVHPSTLNISELAR